MVQLAPERGPTPFHDIICKPCPPACELVFDRVIVSYLIQGYTKVFWELLPTFTDPGPLIFQLQVGNTANNNADDWVDVGLPVENQYFAVDPDQHVWGKDNWTHYRVVLTTPLGTYVSVPTAGRGTLQKKDWLVAREEARKRRTVYRKGYAAQRGYLLKIRQTGKPCPICTDFMTMEPRDPDCPNCYGTGFACGYYYPMDCVWAVMSPRSRRTEMDAGMARGTVDDIKISADMLQTEMLSENDIWVNAVTDDRYYIHRVSHVEEVRGVAIAASVEMRLIPFSSTVYDIDIPEMLLGLDTQPE